MKLQPYVCYAMVPGEKASLTRRGGGVHGRCGGGGRYSRVGGGSSTTYVVVEVV